MFSENQELIDSIRRFNRFYTNILGLLDRHLLDSEFSLAQIRILYEIGNNPDCTAKHLVKRLKTDPGYLSRIIKNLEKRGLVSRIRSAEDGRIFYLSLSGSGKDILNRLNQLSDDQIARLIGALSPRGKTLVARNMQVIESALSGKPEGISDGISIRSELRPGDVGYLIYLHGWIYEKECGYNHSFEGYVCKTFYDFYEHYGPEKDRVWLAEDHGEIIGAIAIVSHTKTRAQLRWFILHPDYRNIGLGRTLLKKALQYCRAQGYTQVFLETTKEQEKAIGMYLKEGFRKTTESENFIWGKRLTEQTYEANLLQTACQQ